MIFREFVELLITQYHYPFLHHLMNLWSLILELGNFMTQIFKILLFITYVYYLIIILSLILTKKISRNWRKRGEDEEKINVKKEKTFKTKEIK